jgi:hypothetical protein
LEANAPWFEPCGEAKGDALAVSLDHLIGLDHDRWQDSDAECLGGRKIGDHLELPWLFDRQIRRTSAFQNLVHQHLRAQGATIPDDLLAHVAPLGWEHIALTGDYVWSAIKLEVGFRPLRDVRFSFLPRAA